MWVQDKGGNPLGLLSLTDDSGTVTVSDPGINYATRPSNWQRLGYGDLCWTYSGFGGATGVILPVADPPFRTVVGPWAMSAAILGTADGNTVIPSAQPGDVVDAAGRAIDEVTICATTSTSAEQRAAALGRKGNSGNPGNSRVWCHVPPDQGPNGPGRLAGGGGGHANHSYDYLASAYGGSCSRGLPTVTRPTAATASPSPTARPSGAPDPLITYCRATTDPDRPYVRDQARLSTFIVPPVDSAPFPQAGWTAVVPPSGSYPGQNYATYGRQLLADGCQVPLFTGYAKVVKTADYCLNGTDGSYQYSGTATATSNISQADADAQARAAAQAAATTDRTAKLPAGATDGVCRVYTSTQTLELDGAYCLNGTDRTVQVTGSGTATSTVTQFEADKAALAAAVTDAQQRIAAEIARVGGTAGTCTVFTSAPQTVSGTADFCLGGSTSVSISFSGTATATSTISLQDAESKALLDAGRNASADLAAKTPAGSTPGNCTDFTATRLVGGTASYCLSGVDGSYSYEGSGTGTSTVSQAEADANAEAAAVSAADADRRAKLPAGATAGACTFFSSTVKVGGSITYCAAGSGGSLSFEGTGSATSTVSKADADAKAQAIAQTNAEQAKRASLPAGATEGGCPNVPVVPTVTISPSPQVTISGTGQVTIATEPPRVVTGCGTTVYPWPPKVPVALFGNCVPTPYPTPTPTSASATPAPTSASATPAPTSASPYPTPTPTSASATPAPTSASATPSTSAATPSPSPSVPVTPTLIIPTVSTGGGNPELTVPAGSTPSTATGTVTARLTNGPSVVTVTIPVVDLVTVATGGTVPSATTPTDDGGLADTGSSWAPMFSAALALLGLALLVIPMRRRG